MTKNKTIVVLLPENATPLVTKFGYKIYEIDSELTFVAKRLPGLSELLKATGIQSLLDLYGVHKK